MKIYSIYRKIQSDIEELYHSYMKISLLIVVYVLQTHTVILWLIGPVDFMPFRTTDSAK
jgi:hypothetical protein